MTTPSPITSDVIVNNQWRISHKIGSGSFGEIFQAIDVNTQHAVAIKIEQADSKYPQLIDEYKVYQSIIATSTQHQLGVTAASSKTKRGAAAAAAAAQVTPNKHTVQGFPLIYWFGQILGGKYHCLVMELLSDSLETLYNRCNRKFSLKTVLELSFQLLDRIEQQHRCGWLHRDIKPDNFLLGRPNTEHQHTVYVIDMGLCKQYADPHTNLHIPYKDNKKLIGTPRYASLNTHLGIEQCRRDDLESIGYMLLYFLVGKLPWQGLKAKNKQEKYERITKKKSDVTVEQLCKTCPAEFAKYLKYCRALKFTDKPDYAQLKKLFKDLYAKSGFQLNTQFDWLAGVHRPATTAAPAAAQPAANNVKQLAQQVVQNLPAQPQQLTDSDKENGKRAAPGQTQQLPPTHPMHAQNQQRIQQYYGTTPSQFVPNAQSPSPSASPQQLQQMAAQTSQQQQMAMTAPGYRPNMSPFAQPQSVHRHVSTAVQPPSPSPSGDQITPLMHAIEQLEKERDLWKRKSAEYDMRKPIYEAEINNLRQHIANYTTMTYTSTTTVHTFFDPPVPKPEPHVLAALAAKYAAASRATAAAAAAAAAAAKPQPTPPQPAPAPKLAPQPQVKQQATPPQQPAAQTTGKRKLDETQKTADTTATKRAAPTPAAAKAAPVARKPTTRARAAVQQQANVTLTRQQAAALRQSAEPYSSNSDASRPSINTFENANMPHKLQNGQHLLTFSA